jgi:predicted permease
MQGSYSASDDASSRRAVAFYADVAREAAALPGMVSVSAALGLPIDEGGSNGGYMKEGQPFPPEPATMAKQNATWGAVAPGFFNTLGIAIKSGREFDQRDSADGQFTVIINETMAKTGWPNEDPIGRRIAIGWDSAEIKMMTIVGVVADVKQVSLDAPVGQELYVPVAQHPRVSSDLKIIARTSGAPEAQTESLRRIAQRLNAEVPLKFTTAEILISDTLTAPRFRALLIGTFSIVALILAVVGVASVMACVVTERRSEIGIRMALGAQPEDVVRHFTLRGLRLAGLGLALGTVLSLLSARFLQGLLYGISASDPLVFAGVTGLLLIAAVGACVWPSRRAAKVDPLVVLRSD